MVAINVRVSVSALNINLMYATISCCVAMLFIGIAYHINY